MDSAAEYWRKLCETWPANIERRGSVTLHNGEVFGFDGFLVSAGIALFERQAPDASGARKAFVAFEQISMIKLLTVMESEKFYTMGFRPPGAPKPAAPKPAVRPAPSAAPSTAPPTRPPSGT